MRKELDEALCKDFPNLYSLRHDRRTPFMPMAFGFECGDGWEPLIRRLSEKLEPAGVVAHQVKEKFGGLRFYIGGAPNEIRDLIEAAERESFEICEECGKPGALRDVRGWMRTLCDEHARKRGWPELTPT